MFSPVAAFVKGLNQSSTCFSCWPLAELPPVRPKPWSSLGCHTIIGSCWQWRWYPATGQKEVFLPKRNQSAFQRSNAWQQFSNLNLSSQGSWWSNRPVLVYLPRFAIQTGVDSMFVDTDIRGINHAVLQPGRRITHRHHSPWQPPIGLPWSGSKCCPCTSDCNGWSKSCRDCSTRGGHTTISRTENIEKMMRMIFQSFIRTEPNLRWARPFWEVATPCLSFREACSTSRPPLIVYSSTPIISLILNYLDTRLSNSSSPIFTFICVDCTYIQK